MIPAVAHFVWFGARMPWILRQGPVSACANGGFERVVLHHEPELDEHVRQELAESAPELEFREIPDGIWSRPCLGATGRSNLLRLDILHREGGVYFDTDVLVLRGFKDLLGVGFFCGEESVVFSTALRRSRDPLKWGVAFAKTAIRRICRWLPAGWRLFRRIDGFYEKQPNNAVMGAEPGHPLVAELLDRAVARSKRGGIRPKNLGVLLLQEILPGFRKHPEVRVLAEEVFSPLPPDLSAHWFRGFSPSLLREGTRAVHWYSSLVTPREYAAIRLDREPEAGSGCAIAAILRSRILWPIEQCPRSGDRTPSRSWRSESL